MAVYSAVNPFLALIYFYENYIIFLYHHLSVKTARRNCLSFDSLLSRDFGGGLDLDSKVNKLLSFPCSDA